MKSTKTGHIIPLRHTNNKASRFKTIVIREIKNESLRNE
jgi:hypothetical protein